jgi:hypothetical protein
MTATVTVMKFLLLDVWDGVNVAGRPAGEKAEPRLALGGLPSRPVCPVRFGG